MINASQLVVRRGQRIVLENIDFSAGQGVTVGVVGPNGAGKSTLLSALYRNVSIASGQVTVSDHDLASMSRREIAREVAVVSQTPDPSLPLTVRDTVALGRLPHRSLMGYGDAADRNIVEEALTRTDLTDLADRLVTQLSGGERQRVLVARAIAQQAGHLLLDEPTNHLDISSPCSTSSEPSRQPPSSCYMTSIWLPGYATSWCSSPRSIWSPPAPAKTSCSPICFRRSMR